MYRPTHMEKEYAWSDYTFMNLVAGFVFFTIIFSAFHILFSGGYFYLVKKTPLKMNWNAYKLSTALGCVIFCVLPYLTPSVIDFLSLAGIFNVYVASMLTGIILAKLIMAAKGKLP